MSEDWRKANITALFTKGKGINPATAANQSNIHNGKTTRDIDKINSYSENNGFIRTASVALIKVSHVGPMTVDEVTEVVNEAGAVNVNFQRYLIKDLIINIMAYSKNLEDPEDG